MSSIPKQGPDPKDVFPSYMPSVEVAWEKDSKPAHVLINKVHRYQYFFPACQNSSWVIAVDIDRPDALTHLFSILSAGSITRPNYVIERASNGHVHAGWFVPRVSTGKMSRLAPMQFFQDVRYALTAAFDADMAFANQRLLNPWWEDWTDPNVGRVMWGPETSHDLKTIKSSLVASDMWSRKPVETKFTGSGTSLVTRLPSDSRNCYIFDNTRLRRAGGVADVAKSLNDSLDVPLRPSELEGIVRSISSYEAQHGQRWGESPTLAEREFWVMLGTMGGSMNTESQREARTKGPASAAVTRSATATTHAERIRSLHEAGRSQREIMDELAVSRATVTRALASAESAVTIRRNLIRAMLGHDHSCNEIATSLGVSRRTVERVKAENVTPSLGLGASLGKEYPLSSSGDAFCRICVEDVEEVPTVPLRKPGTRLWTDEDDSLDLSKLPLTDPRVWLHERFKHPQPVSTWDAAAKASSELVAVSTSP